MVIKIFFLNIKLKHKHSCKITPCYFNNNLLFKKFDHFISYVILYYRTDFDNIILDVLYDIISRYIFYSPTP